jgi:hypothetical protein
LHHHDLAHYHHANIQAVDGTYQFIQSYLSFEQKKIIHDLLHENGYLDILFHHEYNWRRGLSTNDQKPLVSNRAFDENQMIIKENCTLSYHQTKEKISIDDKRKKQCQLATFQSNHHHHHEHHDIIMNKNTRSGRNHIKSKDDIIGNDMIDNDTNDTIRHIKCMTGRSRLRIMRNHHNHRYKTNSNQNNMKSLPPHRHPNQLSRRRLLLRRASSSDALSYQSNSFISLVPPSPSPIQSTLLPTRQTSIGETQLLSLPIRANPNHLNYYRSTMDENSDDDDDDHDKKTNNIKQAYFQYDDYYTSNDYDDDCDFTVTDLSILTGGSDSHVPKHNSNRHLMMANNTNTLGSLRGGVRSSRRSVNNQMNKKKLYHRMR